MTYDRETLKTVVYQLWCGQTIQNFSKIEQPTSLLQPVILTLNLHSTLCHVIKHVSNFSKTHQSVADWWLSKCEPTVFVGFCSFYRATAYNATHGIATRKPSICLRVCLSVCLSNAWIVTKRKKLASTFLYQIKDTKNDWSGMTSCIWNFEPNWPHSSKDATFYSIFARGASAMTPSEKKLNQH